MSWVYIVLMVIFGLFLYVIRCRLQMWYGFLEIIVALVVIYLAFNSPIDYLETGIGYSPTGVLLQHFYGVLAGLYIFVRGMDNIRSGLSAHLRTQWDAVFRGHASQI
jgi:hypothetical protein